MIKGTVMTHPAVRRRRSAFAAGLATMAMILCFAAPPAQAVAKIDYYVALGDSYAAGQGAGPYLDGCFRSENAYAELADDLKAVKFVTNAACGGRTTQGVVNEQLGQLNRKTELVTITAGGNNLGFANIVTYCLAALDPTNLAAAEACGGAMAYAKNQITSRQLLNDLVAMIKSVRAAAPNARIVVTGYPYLFDPVNPDPTNPMSLFISQATLLADDLNDAISDAAVETKVQYVAVDRAFLGHGALSLPRERWINFDPLNPVSPDNLHPNAEGYQAYFAALRAAGVYSASKKA
jgi:lysophospholipase L1-like esterase